MILYNVTVSIDKEIVTAWLKWMKEMHIPEVMECNIFVKAQLNRVISKTNNEEYTYAISYKCNTMKDMHIYQSKYAPLLQEKHYKKFGDKAIAFRTLLEVIDEFY